MEPSELQAIGEAIREMARSALIEELEKNDRPPTMTPAAIKRWLGFSHDETKFPQLVRELIKKWRWQARAGKPISNPLNGAMLKVCRDVLDRYGDEEGQRILLNEVNVQQLVRDALDVLGQPSTVAELQAAPTGLQQMLLTRILRFLAGAFSENANAGASAEGHAFSVAFRFCRPAVGGVESAAPEMPSPAEAVEWLASSDPGAICLVGPKPDWYQVVMTRSLALNPLARRVSEQWCLYTLANPATDVVGYPPGQWEILVGLGETTKEGLVKGTMRPRVLAPDESMFLGGLLRFAASLVPGLWPYASPNPVRSHIDWTTHYRDDNVDEAPLRKLALQLAGVPDAVIAAFPVWHACILSFPDAFARPLDPMIQLWPVADSALYEGGGRNTRFVSLKDQLSSPSVRAFQAQRREVLEEPTPSNNLGQANELATYCAAVPLGLGRSEGAKGILYVHLRRTDDSSKEEAAKTLPVLELIADFIGQIFGFWEHQEALVFRSRERVRGQPPGDPLTGWKSATDFTQRLDAMSDDWLPVILVHLQYPEPTRTEVVASAQAMFVNAIQDGFHPRLAELFQVPGGGPAESLYTGYVLDRDLYAIEISPEARRTSGDRFPQSFYEAKTRLAQRLRLVQLTPHTRDDYFIWVRAAAARKQQAVAEFIKEQERARENVAELEAQIVARDAVVAAATLEGLRGLSPSEKLGWKMIDPAILLEDARVHAVRALQTNSRAPLIQGLEILESIPTGCRPGAWFREKLFALRTLIAFGVVAKLKGDPPGDLEAWFFDADKVDILPQHAHRPVGSRSTEREISRIKAEITALSRV